MQNDPLNEFFTQGPIIRLMLMVCFLGLLWVGMLVLVQRRDAERRRRRREGLPPMPNIFIQSWALIDKYIIKNFEKANPNGALENQPSPSNKSSPLPMPDLDLLTADLPEPDLEQIVEPAFAEAAHAAEYEVTSPIIEGEYEMINDNIPPDSALSEGQNAPISLTELPADAVEVLRVWRDLSDGALIIQMNGIYFQAVSEMRDRGMVKRFMNIVRDLVQMARIGAQAAGLQPPSFDSTAAVVSQPGDWNKPKVAPAPAYVPPPLADRPSLTADPTVAKAMKSAESPPAMGGIADQIEELLQYRLSQTPIFTHRSIHVRPAAGGAIRIEVDGRFYEAIDQVVDVDVREFIQQVIREWEARQ